MIYEMGLWNRPWCLGLVPCCGLDGYRAQLSQHPINTCTYNTIKNHIKTLAVFSSVWQMFHIIINKYTWESVLGFQSGSKMTTLSAPHRFTPNPPTQVDNTIKLRVRQAAAVKLYSVYCPYPSAFFSKEAFLQLGTVHPSIRDRYILMLIQACQNCPMISNVRRGSCNQRVGCLL